MSNIIGRNEPLNKVVCNSCRFYERNNFDKFTCKAFDVIPDEILSGFNKHSKPLPGQKNNIVFEPKTDKDNE